MNARTGRSIAALCLLAAGGFGLAVPAQAQVTVELTGEHGNSEGSCTQINKLLGTFDCTYGGTNLADTDGGWSGPSIGGTYFAAGSIGDDIAYTPVAGDAKINPTVTGSLTVTGTGPGATVEGTIVIGPAVRNLSTGQTSRAVEGWSSITHTLAATAVSSAVSNGDGGFDYVIGSAGAPEELCLAPGGACFGNHEVGSDTTGGPADFWGVGGVAGVKPNVGIESLEKQAGITATGTTDQRNIGATTTAVIADPVCNSNSAVDCDESSILWTSTTPEDPGYDNLVMAFSTDAAGNITSGQAWWTQTYRIGFGDLTPGDNSNASGTFTFTGTSGPAAPDAQDFAATVLQGSTGNTLDTVANSINFDGDVTVTIITNGTLGTATVNGDNTLDYDSTGAAGTDTIVYEATDGTDTDQGTITITVEEDSQPVAPDAPLAISTQGVAPSSAAGSVNVATLGGYVAGNSPSAVTITTVPTGTGNVATVAGTTITFTPGAAFFTGDDTIGYTITDGNGDTDEGVITVTAADVQPVLADGAITTDQDETSAALALPLTAGNGSAAQHSFTVTTNGTSGTCAVTGTSLTYTPSAGFTGSDSCVVEVTDGNGDTDTGTFAITVNEVSDDIRLPGGGGSVDAWSLALLGALPLLRRRRRS